MIVLGTLVVTESGPSMIYKQPLVFGYCLLERKKRRRRRREKDRGRERTYRFFEGWSISPDRNKHYAEVNREGRRKEGLEGMVATARTKPTSIIVRPLQITVDLWPGGLDSRQARCCLPASHRSLRLSCPLPNTQRPKQPRPASLCEQKSDHMLPEVRYVTRFGALCKISPTMEIAFSCCI